MGYRIRIECGNCYSRNNNCGCVATGQNYKVMVDNDISRHTKTEEHVNIDKDKK